MQVVSGRGCPRRPRKGRLEPLFGNGRETQKTFMPPCQDESTSQDLRRITQNNKYVVLSHESTSQDFSRITQNNGLAAPSGSSQHCCRPVESQRHGTSTAVGARTPYPLRRSLLAFGIEPGQTRDAHARHANARARRSQVDAAARNSQRHVSVVSQRRVGRRSAVGRSGSCATRRGTGRDPGPCSVSHRVWLQNVPSVRYDLGSHTGRPRPGRLLCAR
jgi:hypothetical protein